MNIYDIPINHMFLQGGTIIRQGALLLILRMAAGGHYYFDRHYYRFCENLQGGTIIQQALLLGKLEYLDSLYDNALNRVFVKPKQLKITDMFK